jgi:hypothetical protein
VSPGAEPALASWISAAVCADEMPLPGTENCTVAKAMCPEREIWPGAPYGPVTELTPAACSKG